MVGLGTIAILGYLFYILFIKGLAWALLLFVFGVYGGNKIIEHFFVSSKTILFEMIIGGKTYHFSWAVCIAVTVSLLGIGYFMKDES